LSRISGRSRGSIAAKTARQWSQRRGAKAAKKSAVLFWAAARTTRKVDESRRYTVARTIRIQEIADYGSTRQRLLPADEGIGPGGNPRCRTLELGRANRAGEIEGRHPPHDHRNPIDYVRANASLGGTSGVELCIVVRDRDITFSLVRRKVKYHD
jgi:hypothetical protein